MDRLTELVTENCSKPFYRFNEKSSIDIRYRYCIGVEKAIDKLAEYENTGLTPQEIENEKRKYTVDYIKLLNARNKIKELQKENEELKQQLVFKPKFEIGNYFYIIRKEKKDIKKGYIKYIWNGRMDGIERFKIQLPDANNVTRKQNELFATKEQAEQKLKELKGGSDE